MMETCFKQLLPQALPLGFKERPPNPRTSFLNIRYHKALVSCESLPSIRGGMGLVGGGGGHDRTHILACPAHAALCS